MEKEKNHQTQLKVRRTRLIRIQKQRLKEIRHLHPIIQAKSIGKLCPQCSSLPNISIPLDN
jgi:hypothetical protein